MFYYKITFLGGHTINVHAPSPKDAYNKAMERFSDLEVINIKYVR